MRSLVIKSSFDIVTHLLGHRIVNGECERCGEPPVGIGIQYRQGWRSALCRR